MPVQPLIIPARSEDLPTVYRLFEEAILFQRKNHYRGWEGYDREFIKREVENGSVYKLVSDGEIVCIFSVCYSDAWIWREREKGDALYLHRLVLNRAFEGEKVFKRVLDWTVAIAKEKSLVHIRMDTWAENEKLIGYYKTYGFRFVENYKTADTKDLPLQHRNLSVALLELSVDAERETGASAPEKVNITEALSTIETCWSQKKLAMPTGSSSS